MNYVNVNNDGEIIFISEYPILSEDLTLIETQESDLKNKKYSFELKEFVDNVNLLKQKNIKIINNTFKNKIESDFYSEILNKNISNNLFDLINELEVVISQLNVGERFLLMNEFYLNIDQLKSLKLEIEKYIFGLIQKRNSLLKQNLLSETMNDLKNVVW